MQSTTYEPVPYAIGGVAYPRPTPVTIDSSSPGKHFGPEAANGFKPMFFSQETRQNDAEAQLRLDWEQAASRAIARAYSGEFPREKGGLLDLTV